MSEPTATETLTHCKACGDLLPPLKTTFCQDACAKRWRNWKRRERQGETNHREFFERVIEVAWTDGPAVGVRDGSHFIRGRGLLVRGGQVIAYGPVATAEEHKEHLEAKRKARREAAKAEAERKQANVEANEAAAKATTTTSGEAP